MTRHSEGDHRECSDAYRGELVRSGRFRVAVCRDGHQWLYQRRRAGNQGGGAAWDTLGYFQSRDALIRLHRSLSGSCAAFLADLPETIERKGRQ